MFPFLLNAIRICESLYYHSMDQAAVSRAGLSNSGQRAGKESLARKKRENRSAAIVSFTLPFLPRQMPCYFHPMTWLSWALLSAFFAGITAILAKVGVAGIDPNLATAIRTAVVVVFTWLLAFVTRPESGWQGLSKRTWLFLVLSGFATGLSWLCYFRALAAGPASRVAPIDKLSVAFVILFGALFLGEKLTWVKAVGGLLIVAGSIVIATE